jgi:hypothetical protein
MTRNEKAWGLDKPREMTTRPKWWQSCLIGAGWLLVAILTAIIVTVIFVLLMANP